jgi:hypothetical protein
MKMFTQIMMTVFIMVFTAVCFYTRWSVVGASFMAVLALAAIWEKHNG